MSSITQATRVFKFGSLSLPDPNPKQDIEQVKEFYSMTYSALTNATIKGPVVDGDTLTYTFETAVGTKG